MSAREASIAVAKRPYVPMQLWRGNDNLPNLSLLAVSSITCFAYCCVAYRRFKSSEYSYPCKFLHWSRLTAAYLTPALAPAPWFPLRHHTVPPVQCPPLSHPPLLRVHVLRQVQARQPRKGHGAGAVGLDAGTLRACECTGHPTSNRTRTRKVGSGRHSRAPRSPGS